MTHTEKKRYDIIPSMEDTDIKTAIVTTEAQTRALDSGRNKKGLPEIAQHRNRLGKEFMARMRADFQKHGIATIERVRKEKPAAYLELIARMVPMQMDVNVNHTFMDLLQEAQRKYTEQQYKSGNIYDVEAVVDES